MRPFKWPYPLVYTLNDNNLLDSPTPILLGMYKSFIDIKNEGYLDGYNDKIFVNLDNFAIYNTDM